MKTKMWIIMSLVLVVSIFASYSLIGCKEEASEETAEETTEEVAKEETVEETVTEEEGDIVITVPTMEGWLVYQPYIDKVHEFESETGYKVDIVGFPYFDMLEKQYLEASSPSGVFDTVMGDHEGFPTLRDSGALLPLNDYIERDYGSVEEWKSQFFSLIETSEDEDGNVLGVPFVASEMFIVYQDKHFADPAEQEAFKEQYGYDLEPPKTFEQLLDVSEFLTRDTDNDGEIDQWGMVMSGDYKQCLRTWFGLATSMGMNGPEFHNIREGTEDFDKSLEAIQYWYELIYEREASPKNTAELGHAQIWEMWKAGKIAMSFFWWGDYTNRPEFELAGSASSMSLPVREGLEKAGWGSWWTQGIFKSSKNPDATWEYLKWSVSEEIQNAMSEFTGQPSVILDLAKEQVEKGWTSAGLVEGLQFASNVPLVIELPNVSDIVRTNLQEMLTGLVTPEECNINIATDLEEFYK